MIRLYGRAVRKSASKITEYSVQRIASDAFQSIALCFILRPKQLIAFNFTVNYLPIILGLCGCRSLYFRIYCLVSVILSGLLAGIKSGVKKGHAQVTTLDLTDRSLQFFDDLRQTPATINKIILSGALFTSNHLAQIPKSVCHINLSNHNFSNFDLQQIPHAEIIDLSNCDLRQTDLTNPSKNLKTLILTNSLLKNDRLPQLPPYVKIIN